MFLHGACVVGSGFEVLIQLVLLSTSDAENSPQVEGLREIFAEARLPQKADEVQPSPVEEDDWMGIFCSHRFCFVILQQFSSCRRTSSCLFHFFILSPSESMGLCYWRQVASFI